MLQHLLLEFNNEKIDTKILSKDPETALKTLISQQSNGHHAPELIHSVIRLVMGNEDNKLKRLLYYYFETINKDDKGFFICLNQIKKDLVSPNEYVRGLVLKFVSTLQNVDFVLPLLKEIKENLNNKCSYVRLNAVFCLGELGIRFDLEVEEDVLSMMKRESASQVLIVGFDVMHKLGMNFDDFLDIEYPREIMEALVDKIDDVSFLKKALNTKFSTVSFSAACKLLSRRINKETCIENIIRILEASSDLKQDFIPYLKFIDSHSLDLLNLIDVYEPDFSSQLIDVIFKNADTSEFLRIADFLYQKYNEISPSSDKKKAFKILLLEKITEFSSTHCVFIDELVHKCLKTLTTDDPEVVFASLGFLNVCLSRDQYKSIIHEFLIQKFAAFRYGKIIRMAFDVMSKNITKENYEKLLDRILEDLENADQNIFYLSKDAEIFVGSHIAICITDAYENEWNLKTKAIGVLLKIMEVGNALNILDLSSKSTITVCVRALLNGKNRMSSLKNTIEFRPINVLKPVEFDILKTPVAFKKFHLNDPLSLNQSTIQLSGLGDPLYIEANCSHSKYEIALDMLVINQTSSYLQDISLDFNFSKNIQLVFPVSPFSLQPNSATTVNVQFSILESLSSFVTATATFKYPKKDDYSGKPFVQNLSDVIFDISEFLEKAEIDFKKEWKNLEWENVYSISTSKVSQDILLKILEKVNGHLCDKLETHGFIVGNIACYTLQKVPVLINICVSIGKISTVEIRIRSKNGETVTNVCDLLSRFLKSQQ